MTNRTFIITSAALLGAACALSVTVALVFVPDDAVVHPAGRVVEIIAFVWGAVGASSGILQIRQLLATGSAEDVSPGFLALIGGSFITWLSYGAVLGNWVMLTVNSIGITVTFTTLALALRLRRHGRRLPGVDAQPLAG